MPDQLAKAARADHITITLHEDAATRLFVESIDFIIGGLETRLEGHSKHRVETVFKPIMAEHINAICQTATIDRQILNVPGFSLRFQGLSITGYTLSAARLANGARQLTLRLKQAVGDALAVLQPIGQPGAGLTIACADLEGQPLRDICSERLFEEMLSHLYLPLVNLNSYLEAVLDGQRAPCPELVTSSVLQFKTKAEVLQFAFDRLISETAPNAITRPLPKEKRGAELNPPRELERALCTS